MTLNREIFDDNINILDIKSRHNFILVYNDENYEIKDFINNHLKFINQENHNIINIYTKDDFFKKSKLNNREQLFMLKKIFKIEEEYLPVCIYIEDLNKNVCTSYSLKNTTSDNINIIFKNAYEEIKINLQNNRESDDMCKSIFHSNYLKYSNKKYKQLEGDKSIEYYLNMFIMNRILLDDVNSIYKEIDLLYKETISIKEECNKEISDLKVNSIDDVDVVNKLDEIYDKYNQKLVEVSYLISEKQNIINEKYSENSLIEVKFGKFIGGAMGAALAPNKYSWTNFKYLKNIKNIFKSKEDEKKYSLKVYGLDYKNFFDDKSKTMINTCEETEKILYEQLDLNGDNKDFSVCASGYWKAIEVELNIIFIDTIRKSKGIINEIPSKGISYKKEKYEVFSGYKNKKPQTVNINKLYDGKLCSCMLGELINISKNYNNNELGKIIYDLYLMIKEDNDCEFLDNLQGENIDEEINLFMNSMILETSDVVYGYRNKYSHTGVMTKEELFKLKEILLKDGGLYYKIGLLKKQLNNLLC